MMQLSVLLIKTILNGSGMAVDIVKQVCKYEECDVNQQNYIGMLKLTPLRAALFQPEKRFHDELISSLLNKGIKTETRGILF